MGSSSRSSGNTGEEGLPPGFRFHPTDEELVSCYLVRKVLDNSFSGIAIAEVDLNKCEPWDLPVKAKMGEKEWYFFSLRDRKYPTGLRTNRATEAGYWKATGKDKEVFKAHTDRLIGMKKTLVFYRGRAPKGEKTNWVMHEYRLEGHLSYHQLSKNCKDEWVVCRINHKNSGGKKITPGLINRNFYSDECLGSHSLPALLESPTYATRAMHNEETELSDMANIHLCNNNNILPNDPQFNLNMRTANPMSCIFSQMPSSGSFSGVPSQMGLPSNPILMALAEQYSVSELNLKQCKMEPSSSGANNDNSLKISHEEQWNMGRTRHDQQQQINIENNGISHTPTMETHGIDPQDHTAMCLNPDQMNPVMFNRETRPYQLDHSAEAAPTLDLDSLWAY